MATVRNAFGVASITSETGFLAGIECEIESIHSTINVDGSFWKISLDGSLRNNGLEFISPPTTKERLLTEFSLLHKTINFSSPLKQNRFSERTSIHVHVNCLDLEEKVVRNILLWYVLFEPVFFHMVTPNRKHNIHCVPLSQTVLNERYGKTLRQIHGGWSKYTAMNLLPLSKYGTMEFRHMHGHDDVTLLREWLSALENLWDYGQGNLVIPPNIMTNKSIAEAFAAIFKDTPSVHNLLPCLDEVVSDSLLDVKLALA